MKYQVAVSVPLGGTRITVLGTRREAAQAMYLVAFSHGFVGSARDFYLSSRTANITWVKSDRSVSIVVCRDQDA